MFKWLKTHLQQMDEIPKMGQLTNREIHQKRRVLKPAAHLRTQGAIFAPASQAAQFSP